MKLSLRWKIVGGFGLLLALIAMLGWVTLSLFGSLRTVQRRVLNEAIPQLQLVDELVRSYTAQSAAVRGFLIGSQGSLLDQYEREVALSNVVEQEAERIFRSGPERELLDQLVAAGADFQALVDDQVFPLANAGTRTQAFRVLGQEGTPLISQIETLGRLLRDEQEEKVSASESDLQSNANQATIILLLVLLGALAIGLGLAIALPRRLVANLSRLVDAARAIGRGDLDQKLDIRSGDEVEELAERFVEMQAGLKRLQQLALQDRELEIAAAIQRNLLHAVPVTPGARLVPLQRQANLVGGDWYDVDYDGATLTIAVGDASGKGIAAALMATVVLSVLRAERGLGAAPKRIVERANGALRDATDADSFTTLVYATVDLSSGDVTWLNMGHPPPFVIRTRDGTRQGYFVEGTRNRVLGWFDDPGLAENVLDLQPGDRLVFYTDGFLEAQSPEGEVFGEHRLGKALEELAAQDLATIGEELVGKVESFAAGKLDDDLTMLVFEFEGVPAVDKLEPGTGERWHSRR